MGWAWDTPISEHTRANNAGTDPNHGSHGMHTRGMGVQGTGRSDVHLNTAAKAASHMCVSHRTMTSDRAPPPWTSRKGKSADGITN